MKELLTTLGVAALALATNLTAGVLTPITDSFKTFLANNPTNSWEVWTYGLNNLASSKPGQPEFDVAKGWGGGARVSYWVAPYAALGIDLSYNDSSWTFGNIPFTFRGTINLGKAGTLTPYAYGGPGWNINGQGSSVVAVAGGGGEVNLSFVKLCSFFAEYQHVTTTEPMDRVLFGVKFKLPW